jgi:hypothetical protein
LDKPATAEKQSLGHCCDKKSLPLWSADWEVYAEGGNAIELGQIRKAGIISRIAYLVRARGERREGQQKKVILVRAINNMIAAIACSQQLPI